MATIDPSEFFWKLREELNPTIFTTEWLGNHLLAVDFAIGDRPRAVIEACVAGAREILDARRFPAVVLTQIVESSDFRADVKRDFLQAWNAQNWEPSDAVQLLAIYAFSHVAFRYEL
jgi:hypothetical protein